jgi:vitamin B12 transporter
VVNIITRKGGEGIDWGGSLEVGGYDTRRASARLSWNHEGKRLGASLSHQRSDGFPPLAASDIDAGYRNTSFQLHGGVDAGIHQFDASHWQTQGNNEYLDFFGTLLDQDFLNSRSSLDWNARFGERWHSLVEAALVRDHIDQNQSDDFVHTDRSELKWNNEITVGTADLLVLGYKYSREQVEARNGWNPYDITSTIHEAWAQYDLQRGPHRLIAGARYLDHEDAGSKPTWSLNYGFELSQATRLFASAATAFRVPTANERYGFGGNPGLKPEESTAYEIGFRHRLAPGQLVSGSLYRNDIEEMIQWVPTGGWTGYNRNVAHARIEGLELDYDLQSGDFDFHLGGNWQNPVDRDTGQRLLRRARYSINARVGYTASRWHLGGDLLLSGDRKDFGGVTLASYALVNLDASYRLADDWQLFAKVENLFDEEYQLAYGYNTSGRTGYIGIRYR